MFTAALFTEAKTWKIPKCPSTEEWIKILHSHATDYYPAIKEENKTICRNMDDATDYHTK